MTPYIGSVVHYVSHGTPIRQDGTQAFPSECRAAVVTEIHLPDVVGLCVLNPTGMFFQDSVLQDDDRAGGTWHWPEHAE